MSKYISAVICLVLLATAFGQLTAQDDAICERLRAIHTAHGDQLLSYLSEVGKQCLVPAVKPTAIETPGCFASDTASLAASMNIRAEASAASEKLGVAPAGTYAVKGSEQRDDYCWIEIADGWIAQTARVTPANPVESRTTGRSVSQSDGSQEGTQAKEPIWSADGTGQRETSVDLTLSRGIYELNVEEAVYSQNRRDEYISLNKIISQPEDCVHQEEVSFPSTLRIERSCRIFGTLLAYLGFSGKRTPWRVSITQVSDDLPALQNGEEWSVSGRGFARVPVNLRFQPGIYRFARSGGSENGYLVREALEPNGCVRDYYSPMSSPTQFQVTRSCNVRATLDVGFGMGSVSSWSFAISKLG